MGFLSSLSGSLGISKKKEKGLRDTIFSKRDEQNSTGTETTNATTTGSQTQTGSSANNSSGSTGQISDQESLGSSNQTSQTVGSQNSFSDQFARDLETRITALFDFAGSNQTKLNDSIGNLGKFNVEEFVNSQVAGADRNLISRADELLAGTFSELGGTDATNSTAALLGSRIGNDLNESRAAIRAQATAAGNDIQSRNAGTIAQLSASQTDLIPQLIQALKGGNVQTQQTGTQAAETAETQKGKTDTNVSETSTASSEQNLATSQQVTSVVQEILAQLGISSGTENVKTKGSSSGFDAKLGFGG